MKINILTVIIGILFILFLPSGVSIASIPEEIERIDIIQYGIFEAREIKKVQAGGTSVGSIHVVKNQSLYKKPIKYLVNSEHVSVSVTL